MRKILLLSLLLLVAVSIAARKRVPIILVAGQSNADGRVPLSELPNAYNSYQYC